MSRTELGRDAQIAARLQDPFVRRSLKTALHLRRYMPFYVFGLIWVLTLSLFPSVRNAADDDNGFDSATGLVADDGTGSTLDSSTAGTGTAADGTSLAAGTAGAGTAGTGARTSGAGTGSKVGGGATGAGGAAAAAGQPVAASVAESVSFGHVLGKTRDGRECVDGMRQVPNARYAATCTAAFTGNNGGATYHGVSGDTIRVVRREFPESANSQAAAQINKQAGLADEETTDAVRDEFIKHFDKIYELYGRKIEWVDYESQNGDSTQEALGQGREGACADATYIKQELKAYAVLDASAVFGECAAQREMMVFSTGAYYPETWYRKHHPYLWGGVMECERVSQQNAEYIGKRLAPYKSKWAADVTLNGRKRKYGLYVPDNDEYQFCVNISNRILEQKYGEKKADNEQYNYQLDLSRFPDQAAQATVQFKAAQVTTVILACDPYSTIFLTQAAGRQAYYPEWYIIGTALNDTDIAARLFDPTEVDGHLFGMSQLGSTDKLLGPTSESGVVYKTLTGKTIPAGTTGDYYALVGAYNFFQGAGPIVTPQTLSEGRWSQPAAGAPDYPVGYVSYLDGSDGTPGAKDHTGIDDGREVWWCGGCTGPDDKAGTYIETYGGRRFRNGEWPPEEPPVFKQ